MAETQLTDSIDRLTQVWKKQAGLRLGELLQEAAAYLPDAFDKSTIFFAQTDQLLSAAERLPESDHSNRSVIDPRQEESTVVWESRTPEYIDSHLGRLSALWRLHPQLRLGQLVMNATQEMEISLGLIEDEELNQGLTLLHDRWGSQGTATRGAGSPEG